MWDVKVAFDSLWTSLSMAIQKLNMMSPVEAHEVAPKNGLVFNPKKTQVKASVVKFLDASMMRLEFTQMQKVDAVQSYPYQLM